MKTVLVIEDNPQHQELILKALTDPTSTSILFDVRSASTGAAAKEILAEGGIDAIILDDSLPDTDALQLLSELTQMRRAPPIVMVTGHANERTAVQAMKRGATDYIVKTEEFERALPVVLDRAIETSGLEERVRISERQYRDLLEASNDAIYILIGDRFRYVNRKFAEMFGWSIEELVRKELDYRTLIAPESRPLVEERGRRVADSQPLPTRYEFRANRKNGSTFDVEVSVSYISFDGQAAVLGIAHDITARKAYEKTLLRKNHELSVLNAVAEAITQVRDLSAILEGVVERLIDLLEVDAAGIALLDGKAERFSSVHYRGTSETFTRQMRSRDPRGGVLGLALETQELQIIDDISSDDRIKFGAASREGFRSAVALPLVSHEHCSGVITVFTRAHRTFAEEDINLFVALSRQIAVAIENARLYRKAREGIARLQALSEIARAIGSTLDVEGVFRIVGDRLQRLVPYRRVALHILHRDDEHFSVRTIDRPAVGEPPAVRLHEPVRRIPNSPLDEAMNRQQTVVVRPGSPIAAHHPAYAGIEDVLSAIVPIVADKAALGLFVVSAQDAHGFRHRDLDLLRDLAAHMAISLKNARVFQDLERAYREIRDARDALVRSEKLHSLGELAAGVAHDFNNVLSAILGRAQMLTVMLKDEEMLKSVRVIEKAALDGAGTVRRIQEFAKEKSEGEFVGLSINGLVRDAVDLSTTRVNEMGIGIDMQVDLGEVQAILGNPTELREVLTNLIYNAIDAMPHGGRLAVRTGTSTQKSWFEIEDTGIGMDDETKNKIFDPFFTTKGARGTGLGMSVSYGIVQRHHGTFHLTSARGEGTTIRVDFPAHQDMRADFSSPDAITEDLTGPLPVAEKPSSGARILVIDDDIAVRDVLADILRTGDHQVVAAATGQEGIELFRGAEFDIVFTDLGMPGMDGWEVAHGIKAISPTTPVGLITGWGSTIDPSQLKEKGVDLIVAKPFRFNQVLELVDEAIEIQGRLRG